MAIQLIGLVRGFRFEQVRQNIYGRLIKPLEERGWEVHIFWHTYDKEYDPIAHETFLGDPRVKAFRCDEADTVQKVLENEHSILEKYSFPPKWVAASRAQEAGHLKDQTTINALTIFKGKLIK